MVGGSNGPRERLGAMDEREFIAAWTTIFGGPPAAMLDREAMIDFLFDEGPATLVSRAVKDRRAATAAAALCGALPRQA